MAYNQDYQQQQAGYKGLERFDITIRVIENIDLMGDLFTSLRFRGINAESERVWETFINAFFKLFHITASMLTQEEAKLVVDIETSFTMSLTLTPEASSRFLTHFEDYLFCLKKCGIYDPAVIKQFFNPASSWEKSV
jgi:hypothetical protein